MEGVEGVEGGGCGGWGVEGGGCHTLTGWDRVPLALSSTCTLSA